jgi:type I restriction enzyme R subunit
VRSNTPEQVMHGDFPGAVQDAVLESGQRHQEMMMRVLGDQDTAARFSEIILELLLASSKTSQMT